jgi:dipeptidase E
MQQSILAISSSRVGNSAYLEMAAPMIDSFLGPKPLNIAFVPFAAVDSYDDYFEKVKTGLEALPHTVKVVKPGNAKEVVEDSDVVMVGGGNTFKLLHDLYETGLFEVIRQRVSEGLPYIGWSAGSNLTGPTICTTNDMPIMEPRSFTAFGFFSFQINPHYYNVVIEGFHGETRDMRLEEFLKVKEGARIIGLPEGTAVELKKGEIVFKGAAQGVIMTREEGQTVHRVINPGTVIEEGS